MRPAARGSQAIRPRKRGTFSAIRTEYQVYLLVLPAFLVTFFFAYVPMFINVIAFMDYDLFAGWLGLGSRFVWFKWFQRFLSDKFFYEVAWRTLYYSVVKLIFTFPAPIVLALLLNEVRNSVFKRTVQTISYLPYFVSWVTVSGLIYLFLSTSSSGIINNAIEFLGGKRTLIMGEAKLFLPVLVVSEIWKGVGWGAIIYIAAIASLDQELYDAARIDGAGRWKQMLHITLPGIMPASIILLLLAIGGLFSANFDQMYTLANDVIREKTLVINIYSYIEGLQYRRYSLGTAINLFQGVINFILVFSANFIAKRVRGTGLF